MVVLLQNLLQLAPGVFALFYHYAFGKFSKKAAAFLTNFFLFGFILVNAILFVIIFFVANDSELLRAVMAGICGALGVAGAILYYRSGSASELYIPRRISAALLKSARNPGGALGALALGAASALSECLFTIPLFIMATLQIKTFDSNLIQFELIATDLILLFVPFIVLRILFRSGGNLADVIRMRVRNKDFYRLMFLFVFLLLAAGLYNFGVL